MKVQTRLTYSHGIILATLVIVCIISISMCSLFRDMIHDIVSNRYVKTIYADNIMSAVNVIDLTMNKSLIVNNDIVGELEKINKYESAIVENISKLELLVKSDKGKSLLKKIIDSRDAYFSAIKEQTNAVLLANSNESKVSLLDKQIKTPSITGASFTENQTRLDKQMKASAIFIQAVANLNDHQTNMMEESESESNQKYHDFIVMGIFVTAVLILISFLFGIKMVRSIVTELGAEPKDIIWMLENISQGKLHDNYDILRNQNKTGIIQHIDTLLKELRDKDVIVNSKLALGRQLEESVFDLKRRDVLQDTIKSVLELSLEHVPLRTKLERVLSIVVSIPGISIENKGCIHLKVSGSDELEMVAHKNLHEHLLMACARLKYGECLCGLAASTGKTVFSNKLDDLHSVGFEGMHEHGHYCIPIKSGYSILGVLCLYVKHNHERSKLEEDTFQSITNSIANIIEHGKNEDAVRQLNAFNQTVFNSINDSLIVIDVNDFTIVSANNTFIKEYKLMGDDVIGKQCYDIIHKTSEPCNQQGHSCPVMNMLRTGEYARSEHVHHDTNGNEVHVSCSASPIKDTSGNIVQCVYVIKNISERKYYEKQLQQLAHYDVVTSLPNRILLLDRLNIAIEFTMREGNIMAVLFIDLDKFKAVNDTYGHETGDMLLKAVSKRLLLNVRKSDTVARVGGDEFVIILTKVTEKEDAGLIANKIIASLNKPFLLNGHECHIGGSIGIELYPFSDLYGEIDNVVDTLMKRADMAMYKAKELGKNRYEFYNSELSDETANPLFE
ncbi:MAG: diguanylate cyclase [Nitrospirae bacterium]|nr:diguanylate cyclase [Nitrospirota bacterium]